MKTLCTRSSYGCVRVCVSLHKQQRSQSAFFTCLYARMRHKCASVGLSLCVCVFVYGVAVVYKKIDLLVSFGSNCAFKQLYSVGMQRQRQR